MLADGTAFAPGYSGEGDVAKGQEAEAAAAKVKEESAYPQWRVLRDGVRMCSEVDILAAGRKWLKADLPVGFVAPSPATHAILLQLKAGECVRHSI